MTGQCIAHHAYLGALKKKKSMPNTIMQSFLLFSPEHVCMHRNTAKQKQETPQPRRITEGFNLMQTRTAAFVLHGP